MKKLSVLFVLIIITLNNIYSQEKTKSKEVGLYFSNLDAFGIRYKFGNEKHMFRLTALSLSAGSYSSDNGNGSIEDVKSLGAGLNFGIEFPLIITEKFNFYYGGELGTYYSHRKIVINDGDDMNQEIYSGSGGFIIGFAYNISSNISLSAEIVPGIRYTYNKNGETKSSGTEFLLSNNSAGITLGYRF